MPAHQIGNRHRREEVDVLRAEILVRRVRPVGERGHVGHFDIQQAAAVQHAAQVLKGGVEVTQMFEHAHHDDEVEPFARLRHVAERHGANVDPVQAPRRGGARRRRIEAEHVREAPLADAGQKPSARAADVDDARVRRRNVRRDDRRDVLETAAVVVRFSALPLGVLVLRHLAVVAIERRLIGDAVGIRAAAGVADCDVVARHRCGLLDDREVLAKHDSRIVGAADRTPATRRRHRAPLSRARGTA